jgi:hypothetical protein
LDPYLAKNSLLNPTSHIKPMFQIKALAHPYQDPKLVFQVS